VKAIGLKDNQKLNSLDPKPSDLAMARLRIERSEDRTYVRCNVLG
jgi:hypothetical protein